MSVVGSRKKNRIASRIVDNSCFAEFRCVIGANAKWVEQNEVGNTRKFKSYESYEKALMKSVEHTKWLVKMSEEVGFMDDKKMPYGYNELTLDCEHIAKVLKESGCEDECHPYILLMLNPNGAMDLMRKTNQVDYSSEYESHALMCDVQEYSKKLFEKRSHSSLYSLLIHMDKQNRYFRDEYVKNGPLLVPRS